MNIIQNDENLAEEKRVLIEQIDVLRDQYYENLVTQDNHELAAFVTFRSMEGA